MNDALFGLLVVLILFLGMLVSLEVGRRIGVRRLQNDAEGARTGTGAIDGAVFALLGLLIAFTFSGAAARFDARRDLIVQETNDIGTAYLRLDLLPAGAQPALRDLFRRYVDARLETYRAVNDAGAVEASRARYTALQAEIWTQAIAAGRLPDAPNAATMLLLPALNQMFDITTTRMMATRMHPPPVIFGMLFGLALASALLAGFGMAGGRSRNWLHILGFAAVIALSVYVIFDLEFPRLGLIRVDAFDQALIELRASMK